MAKTMYDITVSESWDLELPVIFYTDATRTTTENISGYTYAGEIKARFDSTETIITFVPEIVDASGGEIEVYIPKEDIATLDPISCDENTKRLVEVGIYRIVKTRTADGRELPCLEGKVIKDKF